MKVIHLILVVLFLSACSNDQAYSEMIPGNTEYALDEEIEMVPPATRKSPSVKKSNTYSYSPSYSERKIIKTGELKLKVKETSVSADNIISYIDRKSVV